MKNHSFLNWNTFSKRYSSLKLYLVTIEIILHICINGLFVYDFCELVIRNEYYADKYNLLIDEKDTISRKLVKDSFGI